MSGQLEGFQDRAGFGHLSISFPNGCQFSWWKTRNNFPVHQVGLGLRA